MSEQTAIQVSDRVMRHAAHVATRCQQRIDEVLANWLEWVITEMPVEALSDEEVLALTELQAGNFEQSSFTKSGRNT